MENSAIATVNNPFGIERGGMYCSLAAETQDERLAVYAAVSNAESLDDFIGTPIDVANVVIQSVEVEDEDGDTRDALRIVLIDDDGKAYGCMSNGVQTAVRNLMGIVGMPPWYPSIRLVPMKKQGRNGYKFTTLEVPR